MSGKRACIFGASGGIGAALVARLNDNPEYDVIHAGSRNGTAPAQRRDVTPFSCDITDESSIELAAEDIARHGLLDLVIVATGILHRHSQDSLGYGPEKSWRSLNTATMADVFAINAIGPALIAKHFLPLLHKDRPAIFAALSARVGSISDNNLGGWHSYRASKAALNMLVQNFAIELRRGCPQAIAVTLHPGTVDTDLSKPFQSGVVAGKLFTSDYSACSILQVLEGLTPEDSGGLFAWDGSRIPF